MNIIFLTISRIRDIKSRGIYADLMRKFRDEGHNVYIVSPYVPITPFFKNVFFKTRLCILLSENLILIPDYSCFFYKKVTFG